MTVIWTGTRQIKQTDLCALWRLRAAWASAQSDQRPRCTLLPNASSCGERIPWPDWADDQADPFAGRTGHVLLLSCSDSIIYHNNFKESYIYVLVMKKCRWKTFSLKCFFVVFFLGFLEDYAFFYFNSNFFRLNIATWLEVLTRITLADWWVRFSPLFQYEKRFRHTAC